MKLVLEIKDERDLAVLLPLLERLRISFRTSGESASTMKIKNGEPAKSVANSDLEEPAKKNFDIEKLEGLFAQLRAMNTFDEITDPLVWQKQLRDEWD